MNLITADADTLVEQACTTAGIYFNEALKILDDMPHNKRWGIQDAVELAKIMSKDFEIAMTIKAKENLHVYPN